MMSGVLLLAGVLMIQCQPQSSVQATNRLVQTDGTGGANNGTADNGTVAPQPGGQSNAAADGKPVAVIYEVDPWAMVLGSDSPTVALYEDGLFIFARKAAGGGYEYASARLSAAERDALVGSLPAKQFFELGPRYETTLITDQPTYVVKLWDGGSLKAISVYGGLRRTDNDRKEPAPAAFIEIYEKLKGFQPAGASRWTPEKVELMIWPYESASDPLPWPKNWPDTTHPEHEETRHERRPDQLQHLSDARPVRDAEEERQRQVCRRPAHQPAQVGLLFPLPLPRRGLVEKKQGMRA